jgi:hypothetical protein
MNLVGCPFVIFGLFGGFWSPYWLSPEYGVQDFLFVMKNGFLSSDTQF